MAHLRPATGSPPAAGDPSREVVATANCNECHHKLNALGFHGENRYETRYCVVCHTEQRKYGYAEAATTVNATTNEVRFNTTSPAGGVRRVYDRAVGNFPNFIHALHNGHALVQTGYDYAGVRFNDIGYSMLDDGQKMCAKCHKNSAQAQN